MAAGLRWLPRLAPALETTCGNLASAITAFEGGLRHLEEEVVARLVATGRSNSEVAAELVLSVKTVEYHLGNVYSKLGVSSRSELQAHWRTTHADP